MEKFVWGKVQLAIFIFVSALGIVTTTQRGTVLSKVTVIEGEAQALVMILEQ